MMELQALELHPKILGALKKAKLCSAQKILTLSEADLHRQTKLSSNDIQHLLKETAKYVTQSPMTTALDIHEGLCPSALKVQRISTGCKVIDEFLRGGVRSGGITEIVGESATGKTQLCMQLCLAVQLPLDMNGLNAGAVYICTEDVFPSKRLHQMIQHFEKKLDSNVTKNPRLGDHIFIEHASDKEGLLQCVTKRIPILLRRNLVKLVVVDSIAALFRGEYGLEETAKRAYHLRSLGLLLHKLSQQHNIPVICVNQVSANMRRDSDFCRYDVIPALGLTWSNLVTSRLLLSRTSMTIDSSDGTSSTQSKCVVRTLQAIFASYLPKDICYYVINSHGVQGLAA
ncbi:DNA repair protein XRCC3-like [Ptychodera flava]|uniref:DNA repair protein XRCC3-like n=1 Tax=Ptychodera flava TaxID=63121 RepID=UPI00396A4482